METEDDPCIVNAAGGQVMHSLGRVKDIPIVIQDRVMPMDLVVVCLKNHEVILGMDWLGKNRATLDCHRGRVQFKSGCGCPPAHTGRPVAVCGSPSTHTGRPRLSVYVRVCLWVSASIHRTFVAVRGCLSAHTGLPCVSVSTHRTSVAVHQYTYQHVGPWT